MQTKLKQNFIFRFRFLGLRKTFNRTFFQSLPFKPTQKFTSLYIHDDEGLKTFLFLSLRPNAIQYFVSLTTSTQLGNLFISIGVSFKP